MTDLTVRRLEMFGRLLVFFAAHPTLFTKGSLGAELVAKLIDIVEQIKQLTASQVSGRGEAGGNSAERAAARDALRDLMDRIVRSAEGISVTVPGVDKQFRFQPGKGDAALLSVARAFVERAGPLRDLFIKFEMPPTFIEDLQRQTADLEQAIAGYVLSRTSHVAAGEETERAVGTALEILQQLDPIVENKLAGNSLLMSQWNNARHLEHAWSSAPVPAGPEANAPPSATPTQ